jgi:hypothetical protein
MESSPECHSPEEKASLNFNQQQQRGYSSFLPRETTKEEHHKHRRLTPYVPNIKSAIIGKAEYTSIKEVLKMKTCSEEATSPSKQRIFLIRHGATV